MTVTATARATADTVPVEHEGIERVVRVIVFGLPPAALAVGGWLTWGDALRWQDLVVLGIMYTLTGFGITVGYHRLFTHRSFRTTRAIRALLAVLGSMAIEGPVIEWVSTHRKHHRFSDLPGDPHSPMSPMPPAGAARYEDWATLTWGGCFAVWIWPTPRDMQKISSPIVTCA